MVKDALNSTDRSLNADVLPDPDYDPTFGIERCVRSVIPPSIVCELWVPVSLINSGSPPMCWTRMPIAPVNKNGYFPLRENDIWASAALGSVDSVVFAKSVASRV
nr:hypothetical protein [Herbiconiux sp. VKM Ac-1786]